MVPLEALHWLAPVLKVDQSPELRYPSAEDVDLGRLTIPEALAYAKGADTEMADLALVSKTVTNKGFKVYYVCSDRSIPTKL